MEVIFMNKLKLLYDVVKTMKGKELFQGTIQVEGMKDEDQFFSLTNEFAKNLLTNETKAKIRTQVDHEGTKVRHESEIECNGRNGHERMCHGFRGPWQHHHDSSPKHQIGFKQKLTKLSFVLHVLNQLKVIEQEDKSLLLTFDTNEIPDDIQQVLQERMSRHQVQHEQFVQHHPHCFIKELVSMQNPMIGLAIRINQNNEVEKIKLTADGQRESSDQKLTVLNFKAELDLTW
jgi:hypothetical protein